MARGDYLRRLYEIEENVLPTLLLDSSLWNTLDVDYEPPRVERLWTQHGEDRIYLHRIHACEKALFHPHPWPSAIRLVLGGYEMGVGYGKGEETPPEAATMILHQGSSYEMVDEDGWHYVRPLRGTSLSVMITGKPWSRPSPGKDVAHKGLPDTVKSELLDQFGIFYRPNGSGAASTRR